MFICESKSNGKVKCVPNSYSDSFPALICHLGSLAPAASKQSAGHRGFLPSLLQNVNYIRSVGLDDPEAHWPFMAKLPYGTLRALLKSPWTAFWGHLPVYFRSLTLPMSTKHAAL